MTRATTKTVECPFKKPIFIWRCLGITTGRAYDSNLVGWKNALTEGVLAITLAKGAVRSNSHAREKSKRVLAKDRSKYITLLPDAVLMIPKDNNARFCPERA
jgi:hypothetical protein